MIQEPGGSCVILLKMSWTQLSDTFALVCIIVNKVIIQYSVITAPWLIFAFALYANLSRNPTQHKANDLTLQSHSLFLHILLPFLAPLSPAEIPRNKAASQHLAKSLSERSLMLFSIDSGCKECSLPLSAHPLLMFALHLSLTLLCGQTSNPTLTFTLTFYIPPSLTYLCYSLHWCMCMFLQQECFLVNRAPVSLYLHTVLTLAFASE